MSKKKILVSIQIALGLGILIFIVYKLDFKEIIKVFAKINVIWAFFATLFTVIFFLISAYNLHFVLNRLYRIPFRFFLKSYTYSYIINFVAPAQMGDASIPIFLRKYDVPVELSGIAYLIDKFNTLLVYCIVGFSGAYFILHALDPYLFFLVPVAFVAIIGIILLLIKLFPNKSGLINKIRNLADRMIIQIKLLKHNWQLIIENFFLSILKWIMLCLAYYFAFKAFMPDPPFPEIGIIPILSTLVGLIPITFGGIGTVELSAMYLFSLVNVNKIVVLNSYIILRLMQYVMAFGFYIASKIRITILTRRAIL
jgi:uncharacterized protein (TIRG00374 family)